ncbi:MAG: type III-B CRISPR-associated protein Cas10/Cmr2 [Streptosporangiaceae bacterium]
MELVLVALSGVQRFIAEARSTADLSAGSGLVSGLASAMVAAVPDRSELIFPADADHAGSGMPNRIAVLTRAGAGRELADAMANAALRRWEGWLRSAFHGSGPHDTPGFPATQWVVVPLGTGGYRDGWARAQAMLAARKRIRDFPGYRVDQQGICALTGRWAVVSSARAPKSAYNVRRNEALSAVGHAKRWYGRAHGAGFPSTWSIATAPYRDAIIRRGEDDGDLWSAVADLNQAVEALHESIGETAAATMRRGSGALPGMRATDDDALGWLRELEGLWSVPDTWAPDGLRRDYDLSAEPPARLCEDGRRAALALARAAHEAGIPPLSPYLAVLAQDADRMGERLGAFPADTGDPLGWHRSVSRALAGVAQRQREAAESSAHLGRVVYAGGDDVLALLPADRALAAARTVNQLFAEDDTLAATLGSSSASTAIVFFHASWPLQSAVSAAQALLKDAKERSRPGLGAAVLTRGGERTRVVLPWLDQRVSPERPMIGYLAELAAAISGPLSGRLASGLEDDRRGLAELGRDWLERELSRRAARHGVADEHVPAVGRTLAVLCGSAPGEQGFVDCADSVLVARFLAAQGRLS